MLFENSDSCLLVLISFRLVAHPFCFFKANESNGRPQQNVNLNAIRRKSVNLAVMMFMHCRQRRLQRLSDCTDSNVIRNSFKGALCGMAPKKLFIKYDWKSKVSIIKVYILLLAKRVHLVQMLFDDLVFMQSASRGACRIFFAVRCLCTWAFISAISTWTFEVVSGGETHRPLTVNLLQKRFQLRTCIPPCPGRECWAVQVVSLLLSVPSAAIGSSTHRSPDLEEIALVFSALVAEQPCMSMRRYSISICCDAHVFNSDLLFVFPGRLVGACFQACLQMWVSSWIHGPFWSINDLLATFIVFPAAGE